MSLKDDCLTMCQEAELAMEKTNGYKLDKSHIFAVNMFDDFEKYMKVPDEWAPAEIKPYTPGVCTLPPTHAQCCFFTLRQVSCNLGVICVCFAGKSSEVAN